MVLVCKELSIQHESHMGKEISNNMREIGKKCYLNALSYVPPALTLAVSSAWFTVSPLTWLTPTHPSLSHHHFLSTGGGGRGQSASRALSLHTQFLNRVKVPWRPPLHLYCSPWYACTQNGNEYICAHSNWKRCFVSARQDNRRSQRTGTTFSWLTVPPIVGYLASLWRPLLMPDTVTTREPPQTSRAPFWGGGNSHIQKPPL